LGCKFNTLAINDQRAGKAIEQNPFLKIWITKSSAYKTFEFGNLDNVKKKGRKPEFKLLPETVTRSSSPRPTEDNQNAAKRRIGNLEDDPMLVYKKLSKKEKLEMVKELIYSKKLNEQDGDEEPAYARSALLPKQKVEAPPSSTRFMATPSNNKMVNLDSTKKTDQGG
jgi:hypothetical protein